jgi:hypothetical protein
MPVRPINAFAFTDPRTGFARTLNEDEVFPDDHRFVKMFPGNFVDVMAQYESQMQVSAPVEQATAAPGEVRRGPGRPRKDA